MAPANDASPGPYDPSSVRDRIRQWQAQGGGVIDADRVSGIEKHGISSRDEHQPVEIDHKPKTPTKRRVTGTRHPGKEEASTGQEEEVEINKDKCSSAPAKRVVSDGHWRKTRKSTGSRTPSRRAAKLASQVVADDNHKDCETSADQVLETTMTKKATHSIPGSWMHRELESTPYKLNSSKALMELEREEAMEEQAGCEDDDRDVIIPGESQSESYTRPLGSADRKHSVTPGSRSRRRQSSGNGKSHTRNVTPLSTGQASVVLGSQSSKKGNILTQVIEESKRMFTAQSPPERGMSVRIPSIEQWLDETTDPFLETPDPPLQEIPPLRPSPHKRKLTPPETAFDKTGLEDDDNCARTLHHTSSRSRRREKKPAKPVHEDGIMHEEATEEPSRSVDTKVRPAVPSPNSSERDQESISKSSPTLNRRGANRRASSPVKDRKMLRKHLDSAEHVDGEAKDLLPSDKPIENKHGQAEALKAPRASLRRHHRPMNGHPLSTIASMSTLERNAEASEEGPAAQPTSLEEDTVMKSAGAALSLPSTQAIPNSLHRRSSRLARHSDLLSVLSLPEAGGKSIKSARSIRTTRSRIGHATLPEIMQEVANDEHKYTQELRTLVDGVIPVLLTCVLSKSDSAIAAGLFNAHCSSNEGPALTKPIVDMGIALERLRTLHKRTPHEDHRAFLTWAHGAQRVYSEYLKVWRMGFQDVVVNLAPATEQYPKMPSRSENAKPNDDQDLPRNSDGDVTNKHGERVDVAFLLRRPLVRLKYLAKTIKGIDSIQSSTEAQNLALKYQKLVEDARQRSNEERSRLEDEAAADIDATRVRDPRTLAPLVGVVIDRTRHVRARDDFNLAFQHSNGQRVDCRVELILRDDTINEGKNGDLLLCEVDEKDRWLLLPPIRSDLVSARNGDTQGEIIVMIRGASTNGQEWQELLSLQSSDEGVGFEWVQMLGLTPIPPQISRSQSFISKHRKRSSTAQGRPTNTSEIVTISSPTTPTKSRTPSPRDVAVPIGEQANHIPGAWRESAQLDNENAREDPQAVHSGQTVRKQDSDTLPIAPTKPFSNYVDHVNDLRSLPSQSRVSRSSATEFNRPSWTLKESLGLSGTSNLTGLKRTRAKRLSRNDGSSPASRDSNYDSESPPTSPSSSHVNALAGESDHRQSPKKAQATEVISASDAAPTKTESNLKDRPKAQRAPSSTPSRELPFIPKARRDSIGALPQEEEEEPIWSTAPISHLPTTSQKVSKRHSVSTVTEAATKDVIPPGSSQPSTTPQVDLGRVPKLEIGHNRHRRSSSPLKHEYEPSTASDTSSDSDASTVAHNETASTSDSSDEGELEDVDTPTPLVPIKRTKDVPGLPSQMPLPVAADGTIKPSDSASQAPYKKVPAQPTKACKTIASIFVWSDTGSWQSLHPDECSIVITPGLIEAFEMSASHSPVKVPSSSVPIVDIDKFSDLASEATSQNDDVRGERPLVALELTPLVPLRRGTAIDISIRSPPTSNSQITTGNNIMFRSRSPEECEALYALINHSRIHNPTYIALQNARGPFGPGSAFAGGPGSRRPGSQLTGNRSSWFSGWGRSSSYRASTKRTASIAQTESSVGTMSSAFSALKRFSNRGGGGVFNIAKSTIGTRPGSRANSVYTSSDNSSGSGTSSPAPAGSIDIRKEVPLGLNNAKIRLYVRETSSKWRDMGSARLTIMRPERSMVGPDGRPASSNGPLIIHEKRIIIHGKTKGEVLLDEQLGESCFERVARTGIAVSVWEDVVGPNGEVGVVKAIGGVAGGRATVYMIQMKSEAETAFTFSLVGRLRY